MILFLSHFYSMGGENGIIDNLQFFGLHSNMYLAEVLELVDKLDSGSSGRMPVRVRVPFSASKATS